MKYKWFSLLAVGARQAGELEAADHFNEKAQELEKTLYDQVDEDVANGLAFTSYFYASKRILFCWIQISSDSKHDKSELFNVSS